MSQAFNIGRPSSFSYSKVAYYLGLFKDERRALLKVNGFRCENQVASLGSVSVDSSSRNKLKKSGNKKSMQLITNVINVTNEAVTSKTTKVKRLKEPNFVDKLPTNLTECQTNSLFRSTPDKLLKFHDLSNASPNYFGNEFQDDPVIDDKNLKFSKADEICLENEKTEAEYLENFSRSSINILDSSSSIPKALSKSKRKGLSSEAMKKLIDQMKSNSKIYSFNCNLEAFLSVCITGSPKLLEAAFKVFLHFSNNNKQFQRIADIKVYNEALKCLEKMRHHDVRLVTSPLERFDVQPNSETFLLLFSCLGRRPVSANNLEDIRKILQWMELQEITLSDVLSNMFYSQDTLKYCIEALYRIDLQIDEDMYNGIFSDSSFRLRNEYQNELLKPLNETLFSSQIPSLADGVIDREELENFTKEQMQLELKGFISIPSIAKLSNKKKTEKNIYLLEQWEEDWRNTLRKTIDDQKRFRESNFLKNPVNSSTFDMYPFFSAVDTEDLVNLLITTSHKLCAGLANGNIRLETLYFFLGCQVYKRYLINHKRRSGLLEKLKNVYHKYTEWYLTKSSSFSYMPRIQWDYIISETRNYVLKNSPPEWPYPVKKSVGQILYNILLSSTKVYDPNAKQKIPTSAFTKVHHQQDGKRSLGIEISPCLSNLFKMTEKKNFLFSPEDLPMVIPPVPWTNTKSGGYLVTQTDFIRHVPHAHLQKKRIAECEFHQLYPIVDSLNQLGSIPWRINGSMLDFIIKLFNDSGWEELDLCASEPAGPVPPKYEQSMTKEERKMLRHQKRLYKKKSQENYSIWCDTLYKLSLANFYRDRIIWLPQNIDFRGRTYPIPPHLTHLSADLFRSTLLFAQGKMLGKEGLIWLKLHIINLSGLKKRSCIQDRLDYAEEVLDDIIDSADNPLDGRKWWTKSDEPWQTLAACKELANALKCENPEEFISHLPIHQDGSCNGLQHYAALGRDEQGAKSVNLKPSLLPQDIYSDVVRVVEERRKRDAEMGKDIAIELEGFVIRKVIKQTIMTTVYGVTKFGAQEQIARQLKYLDFPVNKVQYASYYLATATFEGLGKLFSPTQKIQRWLVKCADGLSHICLQNVEWVTPLGLPVIQPYTKVQYLRGNSCVPGLIPLHFCNDQFAVPNRMKQKNAFPPNFIHSLDSSHMMLTSIYCQQAGISFVSIHDCFWTHACTVPIMSKICREQFVKLHSQPILEDLSEFLVKRVNEYKLLSYVNGRQENSQTDLSLKIRNESFNSFEDNLLRLPKKGTFDLNEVKNSVYFFS